MTLIAQTDGGKSILVIYDSPASTRLKSGTGVTADLFDLPADVDFLRHFRPAAGHLERMRRQPAYSTSSCIAQTATVMRRICCMSAKSSVAMVSFSVWTFAFE